jgi:molybdopterin synthase catalytic subunit
MDLGAMIGKIRVHPDFHKVGMIASHLGVVRGHSLDGRGVKGVVVRYDAERLSAIVSEVKEMPGITEVLVETREGSLRVGDEVMAVVVAGDTRQHVFPALMEAVNRIKAEATAKEEIF